MTLDAARCFRALRSRDPRFDGRFFVGVVTTGIYCRPICPARPARFENLRWFACAAAAEESGFRPCRRCRPETSPGSPAWAGTSATVARALRLIGDGALDDAGVDALAVRLGVGERHLRRLFARHLGASPLSVAQTRRVHFARQLIDQTRLPIGEIAWSSGFRSRRQFNDAIRGTFGAPPRRLRQAVRRPVPPRGIELRLPLPEPFDWDRVLGYLAPRAIPGVESVDGCSYSRSVRLGEATGTLELRRDPEARRLLLAVGFDGEVELIQVVERVRRIFDLDADALAIGAELRRDRRLASRLAPGTDLRVPGAWDGFELAVRAVLGQQVSVAAATTLAGRLAGTWGRPLPRSPTAKLTHVFPAPAELVRADIAQIGLPRRRAEAIRGLARAVAHEGLRLDATASVDEVVARLTSLPGIGPWTAQYVALRALRDPDAFPAGDLGLRRALGKRGQPLAPRRLERLAETWRPWRAYAAMALWMGVRDPLQAERATTAPGGARTAKEASTP